jgi:superfamily II DNA or RNA helicase
VLKNGLYEQLITSDSKSELDKLSKDLIMTKKLEPHEAVDFLSSYISDILRQKFTNSLENKSSIDQLIADANVLLAKINNNSLDKNIKPYNEDHLLQAILSKTDINIQRPTLSISRSSLFTASKNEPTLDSELKREIQSSNKIDFLVSFIKWSGVRLIMEELSKATVQNSVKLRVITTTYMGATDVKAIEFLSKLPNVEVKVSYDSQRTRLHAKSYIFYRDTGFNTAYIGSSNLTNAAISSGLEWNLKITSKDQESVFDKIKITFERYWNDPDFETYTENSKSKLIEALKQNKTKGNINVAYFFDIKPFHFQQEILEKLKSEREIHNNYRNLVVAATGTGKTVISAFDYRDFRVSNPNRPNRLLFIAHRTEILKQSLFCYRGVLHDQNFGELFDGNNKPSEIDNLFLTIQSFNSQDFTQLVPRDYYDYIVIDEIHHAAAPSYKDLLGYFTPKIYLGLTATPERSDEKEIFSFFNNRLSAEIRLPEAIDRKLLSPFQYFGITDNVDLSKLSWVRGGYDERELEEIYVKDTHSSLTRAGLILESVNKYLTDIEQVKGLGFCVSIMHSIYMSDFFNMYGIPSLSLSSESSDEVRREAVYKLNCGLIKFIFVVDLYNEGIDIPQLNTVLFLRPTQSLTVFLQQLGRGLRLYEGKDYLTVLDFVGQANKNYNFEYKFRALLKQSNRNTMNQIKHGFISLPAGCFIELERKAKEYILDNINKALKKRAAIVSKIQSFNIETGLELSLSKFVEYNHVDLEVIYEQDLFSRLCVEAGVINDFKEPLESTLRNTIHGLCAINSRRWIHTLLDLLDTKNPLDLNGYSPEKIQMLRMLQFTIWKTTQKDSSVEDLYRDISELKSSPNLLDEVITVLNYNLSKIDFVDEHVDLGYTHSLDLHCTYTRDQLLLGLDYKTPRSVMEGVIYLKEKNTSVLFVTLNKDEKSFTELTSYKDYPIDSNSFHWQSQHKTSVDSPGGQKLINQQENNTKILLFVREDTKTKYNNASPYTFFGEAEYVSHNGSKPINIVWKLKKSMPPKFLESELL